MEGGERLKLKKETCIREKSNRERGRLRETERAGRTETGIGPGASIMSW